MTEKWTNGHCCCRSGVQDVYSHSLALTEEFNSHELLCVAVVQHFWTQTFLPWRPVCLRVVVFVPAMSAVFCLGDMS